MRLGLIAGSLSFPFLAARHGPAAVYRAAAGLYFFSNALMPQLTSAQRLGPLPLWASVVAISLVRSLGGPLGFPALAVLLNAALAVGERPRARRPPLARFPNLRVVTLRGGE